MAAALRRWVCQLCSGLEGGGLLALFVDGLRFKHGGMM